MTASTSASAPVSGSLWSAFLPLLPFMVIVFAGLMATGMALPVVPRHVHDTLGQGTVMVGFVMGVQYLASVFARMGAGGTADSRGPRLAALCGFGASCGVGLLYLASVHLAASAGGALSLVIAARMLTGVAESFIVTGAMAWAATRLGPAHTGKVIGWIGMAVFAGLGASAPLGTAIYGAFGFGGVAVAVLVTAVAGLAITRAVTGVAPSPLPKLSPLRVLGVVKLPGFGLTLCSLGFAMITAFAVLLFAQRGWGGGALAVTSMGVGFIIGRLLFGHLPDLVGGARVTLACVLVEAVGLAMIWLAPHAALAWLGAALVGGGYGLAFQGLGVEAVRRAPPQSRGSAMGAYIVFQDVAMGLAPPLGGVLAASAGLEAVYLAAAIGAVGSAAVAIALMRRPA
ncbi:MAG TPA: MFS transporter [Ramlibacter sp.]|nr:MFS transporter [Ramlibacter sp.]